VDLRDEILGIKDCGEKVITVKTWDKKVLVRALTAGEKNDIWDKCTTISDNDAKVDSGKMMILTVIASACDPKTGDKIFKAGDYDALKGKSSVPIEQIAQVSKELSGGDGDAIEDAEKN
jgi:hypothetical protein